MSIAQILLDLRLRCRSHDVGDIVQEGIDLAERVTGSQIGYLHFVNADQNSIELVTWSKATLGQCQAHFMRHYPLESAGVWADTARQRTSVVHNDYQAIASRRGYPEGHVHLVRHLGICVQRDDAVVMLMGVGNKPADYDAADLETAQAIAETIWDLVEGRRKLDELQHRDALFREIERLAGVIGFEWDAEEDAFAVDEAWGEVFGGHHPRALMDLINMAAPDQRDQLKRLFIEARQGHGSGFDAHILLSGRAGHRRCRIRTRAQPRIGSRGCILRGFVQDVSLQMKAAEFQYRAYHDGLTGLPNRDLFNERLTELASGDRPELFALHMLDLDEFKPVNDRHGHAAGDEVLKVVAQRLLGSTRKTDLVARLGGDEFAILQTGIRSAEEARGLGEKLVQLISAPISISNAVVKVGVSVGTMVAQAGTAEAGHILREADAALYRSKAAGRGCCTMVPTAEISA